MTGAARVPPDAGADDVARLGGVLARAFAAYPPVRWLLPDDDAYAAAGPELFGRIVARGLRDGEVWTDVDRRAVAVWLPPPAGASTAETPEARTPLAGVRVERAVRFVAVTARHLPDEPHWWLDSLGTEPHAHRRGAGRAAVAPVLARADAERMPVWLRTGAERNLEIYARLGFEVRSTFTVDADGPRWWMLRRAPAV